MHDRGAEIVFQPEGAECLTRYNVASLESVVVPVRARRYRKADGSEAQEGPIPRAMTSWDALYRISRAAFGDDPSHVDVGLARFDATEDALTARFDVEPDVTCAGTPRS